MSTPALAPTRALASRRFSAVLHLIVLLLGTLVAAALLTAYLVRDAVAPASPIAAAPPAPAPFRLLYLRAGQLWSVAPDGGQRQLTHLPEAVAAHLRRAVVASGGQHVVLLGGATTAERAWLLADPGATPRPLPAARGATSVHLHYVDAVWPNAHRLILLVTQGDRTWLARYAIDGAGAARLVAWTAVPLQHAQPLSLSPDGREVAVAYTRAGTAAFAPQVAVQLRRLDGSHASIAYRYLGALPSAVLWAPDRGTVAIAAPARGLVIQKSSGRPVRSVARGMLPADFSQTNAELAYAGGSPGNWQIHVLGLHSETDRVVIGGLQTAPSSLYWTPDARAVLYITGATLWQLDLGTGLTQLVAPVVPGTPLQVVPAPGAPRH